MSAEPLYQRQNEVGLSQAASERSIETIFVTRVRFEEEQAVRQAAEARLQAVERELRDAKAALNQARLAERELVHLKSSLVAAINHDFRTPLTKIDGAAHRIEKATQQVASKPFREDVEARCKVIRDSVTAMTALIENCFQPASKPAGRK